MDTNSLQKIVDGYQYGQFNLLENNFSLKYSTTTNRLLIENCRNHSLDTKIGTCSELMSSSAAEIKKKHPNYFVARAHGFEQNYFGEGYMHSFLVVSDTNFLGPMGRADHPKLIEELLPDDAVLVDPSFNLVTPHSKSGYLVSSLVHEKRPLRMSNSTILVPLDRKNESSDGCYSIPLGVSQSEKLISLYLQTTDADSLLVGITDKGIGKETYYWLGDVNLPEIIGNDDPINQIVETLLNKEIELIDSEVSTHPGMRFQESITEEFLTIDQIK